MVVALVAAYASYEHQREFALHGGADTTRAALWPLSVDGLLILASTGLLRGYERGTSPRARRALWLAFLLGIAMSMAANIAAAPVIAWEPVLVAGWPPVSLLLAVELLARRPHRRDPENETENSETAAIVPVETVVSDNAEHPRFLREQTAEDVMWSHFQRQVSIGNTPTGAELDRVAGTNNYGRAVLRRWRRGGRLPATAGVHPAETNSTDVDAAASS